jgi:hypothetical protein
VRTIKRRLAFDALVPTPRMLKAKDCAVGAAVVQGTRPRRRGAAFALDRQLDQRAAADWPRYTSSVGRPDDEQ